MNRHTLLRIIVVVVAAIIAVLLIIGIVMALTRTGLFMSNDTADRRTQGESSQTDGGSSDGSAMPSDTNSQPVQGGTGGSAATNAPASTTGSIPSTGPSDAATIALVSAALFGATYATALRFNRR